jgi:hypothetical protein
MLLRVRFPSPSLAPIKTIVFNQHVYLGNMQARRHETTRLGDDIKLLDRGGTVRTSETIPDVEFAPLSLLQLYLTKKKKKKTRGDTPLRNAPRADSARLLHEIDYMRDVIGTPFLSPATQSVNVCRADLIRLMM